MKTKNETSGGSRLKFASSVKSPTPKTGARVAGGQANHGFGYRGKASGLSTPGVGSGVSSVHGGTSTPVPGAAGAGGGAWRGDGSQAGGVGP